MAGVGAGAHKVATREQLYCNLAAAGSRRIPRLDNHTERALAQHARLRAGTGRRWGQSRNRRFSGQPSGKAHHSQQLSGNCYSAMPGCFEVASSAAGSDVAHGFQCMLRACS